MNVSLLGKLNWSILHNENKFWVAVLSHKSGQNIHSSDFRSSIGSSYIWRSMVKVNVLLNDGFQFALRRGNSSLWYQDWRGGVSYVMRICLSISRMWTNKFVTSGSKRHGVSRML